MMHMKYRVIIPVLSVLFLSGVAHADGYPQKLDQPEGDYIANADYDSPTASIQPFRATAFSFQLWNKDRTALVPFNDVFIAISPHGDLAAADTVFGGTLYRPNFGDTGIAYNFQTPGVYDLNTRFEDKDGKALADATFQITVSSPPADLKQIAIVALACLAVGTAGYWLGKRRRSRPALLS